jgi:hypothetical protein
MQNIYDFRTFVLNESRARERYEPAGNNVVSDQIAKIRARVKSEYPEVELTGYEGGRDWYEAVGNEPGKAVQRLITGVASGFLGLAKGISDLFKTGEKIEKYDSKSLKTNKDEVLQKWGENIDKTGKNEEKDLESFYKRAITTGKKSFGKDFDIENPKNPEEEVYVDYVNSAAKYYKVK